MARRFHAMYAQAMQQQERDSEKSVRAPGFLQRRLRGAGLRYYDNCELTMYTKRQRQLKDRDIVGIGEAQAHLGGIMHVASAQGIPQMQHNFHP